MAEIRPMSFSVGTIFPYPEAASTSELADFFADQGYNISDQSETGVNITPEGVSVGPPPVLAKKEHTSIIYNDHANLAGFAGVSFITVWSEGNDAPEQVLDVVEELWSEYDEFDIEEEKELVELTCDGRAIVNRSEHDFTRYFDNSKITPIGQLGDGNPAGAAARFESDLADKGAGWYQLIIDAKESPNPRQWSFKIVRRYDSYTDIDPRTIFENISNVIDEAKQDG